MSQQAFGGGFAQGFANVMMLREQQKRDNELLKLRKKALNAQLDLQEKQNAAKQQFFGMTEPEPVDVPIRPNQPRSLMDVLADPEGQMLALQGGLIDIGDLQKLSKQNTQREFLDKLGQDGLPQFSPQSQIVSQMTGDLTQLRPPNLFRETIQTPDGPMIQVFDEGRLGNPVGTLGAPKEEKINPEQAGRISGLVQAQDISSQIRDLMIDNSGNVKISRFDLFNIDNEVPFTDGRNIGFQFRDAIDSVIRARTGAAATEEEMNGLLRQFRPSSGDNDETIVNKMDRLQKFIDGTLDVATLPSSLRSKLNKKGGLPDGVPTGSELVGESESGNPVYRSPDGKLLEVF